MTFEKNYISKKRVKEAIEKVKSYSENKWTDNRIEEFLLQRLGIKRKQSIDRRQKEKIKNRTTKIYQCLTNR